MSLDIDRLRADARRLKKAYTAGDETARKRINDITPKSSPPKHADFLHVIAREQGYDSWPKLKFALESGQMTRGERAERLKMALYHGQRWVVDNLLSADPDLATHNLGLQIAMYDAPAVHRAIHNDPTAATTTIGIRTPILHLAYSKYFQWAGKQHEMLKIAGMLLANGADANDGFPPEPGSDHLISALYGALGHANNMVLAEWLLDHGANPDDDESLYHSTELGHHDGLRLLMKHGVSTKGTNALARAIDFDDLTAVRLLLEYGADPNEVNETHPSGQPIDSIPALHQAARRWCSPEMALLLLEFGANPTVEWQGHTPYATACIYGNVGIAAVLGKRGHAFALTPTEAVLAACAKGERGQQTLNPADISAEDRKLLTRVVLQPDRMDHLKALVEAGLDPNLPDEMGMTPLHLATWAGLPEQVAYLLTLSPDLQHRNDYGGDALGTTVHGAEHRLDSADRDHVACARLLLEAGAMLRQEEIDATGSEKMARFLEEWNADHNHGRRQSG